MVWTKLDRPTNHRRKFAATSTQYLNEKLKMHFYTVRRTTMPIPYSEIHTQI